jgi:[lysine-biosynthesis-protein LysW]--L-2-aminoadipate ligase
MIAALARPRPAAFVVGSAGSATNERLRDALEARGTSALVGSAETAERHARPGDVVVGRLDVRPALDGVQPGLGRLRRLRDRGIRVVNDADTLVAAHDKLATALLLHSASVRQPRSAHLTDEGTSPGFEPPYVVKPRFGSWGRDVHRCESRAELRACLLYLLRRPWFRQHGALVQQLIPPRGFDLRLVVSGGNVVGAVERVAAPGEWRTNVALGGIRRRTAPPLDACRLALAAAAAVDGDLVGVDLLPAEDGWHVIEINGAVDFNGDYALDDRDVFALAVEPFVPTGRELPAAAALSPVAA